MTDAVCGRNDSGTTQNSLTQYPGEEPLSHTATKYREDRDRELTLLGLLEVAHGKEPAAVRKLIFHTRARSDTVAHSISHDLP